MAGRYGETLSDISLGASQSVRRNAGDTAFEAFTPASASGDYDANNPPFIVGGGADALVYTDDIENSNFVVRDSISIYYSNTTDIDGTPYRGGNRQSTASSNIWASATSLLNTILVGGYIYTILWDSVGGTGRWYRADITSDISQSGNWTQLTVSGHTINNDNILIGYDGTNFWTGDTSNYQKFTLSGTTMTAGGTVTVTGANYANTESRVNQNGIYASFTSGAPYARKASLTGTLTGSDKNWLGSLTGDARMATPKGFYVQTNAASATETGFTRVDYA